jgi:hypothetical protein
MEAMSAAESESTTPAPKDGGDGTNPNWSSPGMRIGAVIAILAIAGIVLWLVLGTSSKQKNTSTAPTTSRIGPVLMRASQLKAESKTLGTPIYWAGTQKGTQYEFTRTTNGYLYVRYLPKGLHEGANGTSFLIISTYPFPGAYEGLKKAAKGRQLPGSDGSIYYVNPAYKKSVLMAWPNVDYQVEVYDPNPTVAATIASTGQVVPVRRG